MLDCKYTLASVFIDISDLLERLVNAFSRHIPQHRNNYHIKVKGCIASFMILIYIYIYIERERERERGPSDSTVVRALRCKPTACGFESYLYLCLLYTHIWE